MKGKIANWNASHLSFAGRLTLAQSVLNSMPIYAMQASKLPLHLCAEMCKEIRRFMWGNKLGTQRLNKVA